MTEQFTNDATTVLVQAAGASDATIKVNSNVGFASSGNFRLRIDDELLLCTQVGLTAPTSAPTLTAVAGSTSYHAGTFSVGYTYNTAAGESSISTTANVVLVAGQAIHVATISNLPSYITSLKFYITAAPVGDTTGLAATATPITGTVAAFDVTSEGDSSSPPSSSPTNAWVVTRQIESTTATSHGNGSPVVAGLTAGALTTAFVRLDTAVSQTLTGPLSIPPAIGSSPATTSYGSLMVKLDDKSPGGTATFTFSSIPTGYFALSIWGIVRSSTAATVDDLLLRFNGDTTATYFWAQGFENSGTPASSATPTNTTSIDFAQIPAASAGTGASGFVDVLVPGYTSTQLHKPVKAITGGIDTSGLYVQKRVTGLWSPAAVTAITSVTILTNSGSNFSNGTQFVLYALP